jgi:excisionase family DNA binding protein
MSASIQIPPAHVRDAAAPALTATERAQAAVADLAAQLSELRERIRDLAEELAARRHPSESPPVLLTIEEAARTLRISRTVVWQLIKSGELRSVKIGASRRVPVAAITDYTAALRAS